MTEKNKITTESITYSYKDKKAVANLSFIEFISTELGDLVKFE